MEDPGVATPELTRRAPAVIPTMINARTRPMAFGDGNVSKDGISDLIMHCWPGNSFCNEDHFCSTEDPILLEVSSIRF